MNVLRTAVIFAGGLLIVLIVVVVALSGAFLPKRYLIPWRRDFSSQFTDPRMKLLAHGILAANQHNMQPWRVRLDEQDPMTFWLYVDAERLTPEVDPYGRQAVVTQGTFLEYVRIAGNQLGYMTSVALFPEGEIDRAGSIESIKAKPVAKVTLQPGQPKPDPLYDAMFLPDTSRVAYLGAQLTQEQVRNLVAVNTFEGVSLQILLDSEDVTRFKRFAVEGTRIENDVPAIAALASRLFRPNEYQKNQHRYGFSFEGSGASGPMMYLLEALLTAVPSMNNPRAARDSSVMQAELAAARTPAWALIITKDNSRTAQANAGMLYSRFQLAALTMGFAMQPMSQVLEEFPAMREQYQAVHKAFAPGGGTIQMLVRVGKPTKQVPRSMRRDVREIVVNFSGK